MTSVLTRFLTASLLASWAPCLAWAVTIHVDDDACPGPGTGTDVDPYCSVQTAIDMAVNDDEILVAPGTYNETINFNGKAVTLRSSGGRDVTTIDATGLNDRVVYCVSGEGPDTVLDGFTITGGVGVNGGGMRIIDSSPTILNCKFMENFASNAGGGMLINGGCPMIMSCTFQRNFSQGDGGGVSDNGTDTSLIKCQFLANVATGTFGAGGLLLGGGGTPRVANCEFVGNISTGNGGAVLNDANIEPFVINCVFVANSADGEGDAIYNDNLGSNPTLVNCILWDNPFLPIAGPGESIVTYSNIEGGFFGTGNINSNPFFVQMPSPGPDDEWGTSDDDFGDLHLQETSPCINSGDRSAPHLPLLDLDGLQRVQGCFVDMGVYEFPKPDPITDADTDCDDDVDGVDFAKFAECFNKAGNPPRTLGCSDWAGDQLDFDDDDDVDGVDFAKFAQCFNKAGNPPRTLGCPQN